MGNAMCRSGGVDIHPSLENSNFLNPHSKVTVNRLLTPTPQTSLQTQLSLGPLLGKFSRSTHTCMYAMGFQQINKLNAVIRQYKYPHQVFAPK